MRIRWTRLAGLAIGLVTWSAAPVAAHDTLGRVHFPVSCAASQEAFDRALAMLHSFWFPPATRAFTAIAESDPGCAMAFWGVAMSQRGNPLVGAPPAAAMTAGAAAAEKARTLGGKTDRERDYVGAIGAYYRGGESVPHATRVTEYERAMAALHVRHPADPEAAVLYALALNEAITVLPADKSYARHQQAAVILEAVLARQPDHPGALHYLIHSYDFPPLATRGLAAARRYDQVASDAPHALHMPSHIFSMLGMWPESIRSNRAALGAAKAYVHAMDFLVYAHLQGAQDDEARRLVGEAAALLASQAPPAALTPTAGVLAVHTAFAAIPARYAIERGAWAEAAALVPRPSSPAADAITHFARAMGAARGGDAAAAKADVAQLAALRERLALAGQVYWTEQVEIQRRAAAAWVARVERRRHDALRLMRAAADLEDASEKHVAMENRLFPAREQLGYLLLEMQEPTKALEELQASLKSTPNRLRGYYGAAKAAEQSGQPALARSYFEKLRTLTAEANGNRPEIAEARSALAAR